MAPKYVDLDTLVSAQSKQQIVDAALSCGLYTLEELLTSPAAQLRGHDYVGLLLAVLTARSVEVLAEVFFSVVTSPSVLSAYIRYLRSGIAGRRSLGTRPKRLVQERLNTWSPEVLLQNLSGVSPSLGEILSLVHPVPVDAYHERVFAYLTGNVDKPPMLRVCR